MAEEPLDGLAVGAVAELAGQLEDPSRAHGRHPDPPASPVDLRVAVPGRGGRREFSRRGELGFERRGIGGYYGGGGGRGGGEVVVESNLRAHGEEKLGFSEKERFLWGRSGQKKGFDF